MGTYIYTGGGYLESCIGECRDSSVYDGAGFFHNVIGSYNDKGEIFYGSGFGKTYLGCCENGTIYSGSGFGRTAIGSYRNGEIYYGFGFGERYAGRYEGVEPAAAGALLLLMPGKIQANSAPPGSNNSGGYNNTSGNGSNSSNNVTPAPDPGISNAGMVMSFIVLGIIIALVAIFGYWLFVIGGVFMLLGVLIGDRDKMRTYDKSLVTGRDRFVAGIKASGVFVISVIGGALVCFLIKGITFDHNMNYSEFEPQVYIFSLLMGVSYFIEDIIMKGQSPNINPYFLYNVCRCKRCGGRMRVDAGKGNVLVTCPGCGAKNIFYSK